MVLGRSGEDALMKKKLLSLVTALALCLTLLPAPALAADVAGSGTAEDPWLCGPDGSGSVTAVLADDGTLTVSGTGATASYTSVAQSPWMNIGASIPITKLVIESGVTEIGNFAFSALLNVREVSISEGVTRIGSNAFSNMERLEQVVIPSTVTSIAILAFTGCEKLSEVTLLGRSTAVTTYAFGLGSEEITFCVPCGTKEYYEKKLGGFTVEEAPHTPGGDGVCSGCGLQFTARVRIEDRKSVV